MSQPPLIDKQSAFSIADIEKTVVNISKEVDLSTLAGEYKTNS